MKTILLSMVLLLCFPLFNYAQENADYKLLIQTIRRLDIKKTKQLSFLQK